MKLIHFTFNNFFEYQIVLDNLNKRSNHKHPEFTNSNKLQISFAYLINEAFISRFMKDLCKPLNIQFTTTLEVTKDTEWT